MNSFTLFLRNVKRGNGTNFNVELPKTVHVDDGNWTCCLKALRLKCPADPDYCILVIKSDLCGDSFHYGDYEPVLGEILLKRGVVWQEAIYEYPLRVTVRKPIFRSIKIWLETLNGSSLPLIEETVLQVLFIRSR